LLAASRACGALAAAASFADDAARCAARAAALPAATPATLEPAVSFLPAWTVTGAASFFTFAAAFPTAFVACRVDFPTPRSGLVMRRMSRCT